MKKTTLTREEKQWLMEYISDMIKNMGTTFFTRHPDIGNDPDKLWRAQNEWGHALSWPTTRNLLRFARTYLTEDEQQRLWRFLRNRKYRKKREQENRKMVTVWISDTADSLLRKWPKDNKYESQTECILRLIKEAQGLKSSPDADILDTTTPYEVTENRVEIYIEEGAREALRHWKKERKQGNFSQSVMDLVNIARALQQRKNARGKNN